MPARFASRRSPRSSASPRCTRARAKPWRRTTLGRNCVGVNYDDGQGFMVPKKLKVKSAKQLNGATVCVQPGTTNELNLADYFRSNQTTFQPEVIERPDGVTQ